VCNSSFCLMNTTVRWMWILFYHLNCFCIIFLISKWKRMRTQSDKDMIYETMISHQSINK
jgi:hypothetical protein